MDVNKFNEIVKCARKLRNNISYDTLKVFLETYKTDLNINIDKLDILINNILSNNISTTGSITLPKLNLKYKKTSKEYWIIRGWDIDYSIRKAKECNSIYSHKLRLKNSGYSDDEIKKIVSESIARGLATLKTRPDYKLIIERRTKGLTRDRYLTRINPKTNKLYTEIEANLEYSKQQSRSAKSQSPKLPINNNTRIEYYINKGLDPESARLALFERQIRNGLNYYINKYGVSVGTEKYSHRISKYGEKIKTARKNNPHKWSRSAKRYSDSSKRFFDSIINEIKDLENMSIYYADNEYAIYDKSNNRIYFYDFYIKELKVIIEYHGIAWHPKQRFQKNWKHPYTKETSEKWYDYDKLKEELVKSHGLDIIIIFEDEIIHKKQTIIDELYKRIDSYRNTK